MLLNKRELITVLAALRLFQRTTNYDERCEMEHFEGPFEPLWNDEIDALCEALNLGPDAEYWKGE